MKKNKMAMLGLIIFLIELILLVLAPVIIPYDYTAMGYHGNSTRTVGTTLVWNR